jgi:hypothetical protein
VELRFESFRFQPVVNRIDARSDDEHRTPGAWPESSAWGGQGARHLSPSCLRGQPARTSPRCGPLPPQIRCNTISLASRREAIDLVRFRLREINYALNVLLLHRVLALLSQLVQNSASVGDSIPAALIRGPCSAKRLICDLILWVVDRRAPIQALLRRQHETKHFDPVCSSGGRDQHFASQDNFFAKWETRTSATQAKQPSWPPPLIAPYPMLIQVFRADFTRQITPTLTSTWNYGASRGLNLIPGFNSEFDFYYPPTISAQHP